MASAGSFSLVLHSHIPYVLAHGRYPHGMDWLAEAAAECYLPLLDVFHRLIDERISPKVTIGLTPVLVEQLRDETFVGEFEDYLQQKRDIAEQNLAEFRRQSRPDMGILAAHWRDWYGGLLADFQDRWNRDIVGAFAALQDAGHIEVITSAATHGYLPLIGTDTCVRAQITTGVATYQKHFGRDPRGFWLPECAYRPRYHWQSPVPKFQTPEPVLRKGVDEFLIEAGLKYFFVDSHLLHGGKAIGVYADKFKALEELWSQYSKEMKPTDSPRSPYEAYLVNSSGEPKQPITVLARDAETGKQVWSGETGYPGDEWYLEFHKKHYPGNLRYWRVSTRKDDLGSKHLYEPGKAASRLPDHAAHFAETVRDTLLAHCGSAGQAGVLNAVYDTELFGHWWHEGPEFLYYALRKLAENEDIDRVTCSEYLENNPPDTVVSIPEGSWGEGGYHWIWLNEWTAWTWEKIYQCEREMAALATEFSGNKQVLTLLRQAARELLLLESSDWQFCISTWASRDYAEQRVKYHTEKFQAIASLIRRSAAREEIPPDDWNALGEAEDRDRCFGEVDPGLWAEASNQ